MRIEVSEALLDSIYELAIANEIAHETAAPAATEPAIIAEVPETPIESPSPVTATELVSVDEVLTAPSSPPRTEMPARPLTVPKRRAAGVKTPEPTLATDPARGAEKDPVDNSPDQLDESSPASSIEDVIFAAIDDAAKSRPPAKTLPEAALTTKEPKKDDKKSPTVSEPKTSSSVPKRKMDGAVQPEAAAYRPKPAAKPDATTASVRVAERTKLSKWERRGLKVAIGAFVVGLAYNLVPFKWTENMPGTAESSMDAPATTGVWVDTTVVGEADSSTSVEETVPATTEETLPDTTSAPTTTEKPRAATTTSSIEASTTTVAPTTTETPTTTTETPRQLTFTEEIKSGKREVIHARGLKVGQLVFDKYCTVIEIYVENPVPYGLPENYGILSDEAKLLVEQLKRTDLSSKERLAIEDTIMQRGFIDGNGSPMYYVYLDRGLAAGCLPTARDPRHDRKVYGSYDANAMGDKGMKASDLQAIADIVPEMGKIPGMEDITYIQGHRSSQSAAFEGLSGFSVGDTVTYQGDDGMTYHYELVQEMTTTESVTPDQLKQILFSNGVESGDLVLQVCIDGKPNDRALYMFKPVET